MERRASLKKTMLVAVAMLLLATGVALAADSYAIPWWTVDNGGGSSQGGQFVVTGTIGQPDTGSMSGGPYTLNGGFWNAEGASEPTSPAYEIYLPLVVR